MEITIIQAAAVAFFYYLGQSTWLGSIGYYTTYRPIVGGLLVGLVLGDPVQGTIIGATINLVYLGFISAGGAIPGDITMAGTLGTAIAISSGLSPGAALALAVPIGLLGTLIFVVRMTVNSLIQHRADYYAEQGSIRGVAFMNLWPPQIFLFIISFIPVFIATLYGPEFIQSVIDMLSGKFMHTLEVIGGMMPALGIALIMRSIAKKETIIYFFLGFFLTVYLDLQIVAVAAFALVIAYIIFNKSNPDAKASGEV